MNHWTREKILQEILQREAAGISLSASRQHSSTALVTAAQRLFGSWNYALKSAGIKPRPRRGQTTWTPERILADIRALAYRPRPMRPNELAERYNTLLQAATRYFGSWLNAVRAAGVEPSRLRYSRQWTREHIIEAILKRHLANESLQADAVRPRSLARAGVRHFGSWRNALAAAGLAPELCGTRGPAACQGLPTTGTPSPLPGVAPPAPAIFGLLPPGEDPGPQELGGTQRHRRPTYWSADRIWQALQARLQEKRLMHYSAVYQEDRSLHRAALKHYRRWDNVLLALGLNPQEHRKSSPVSGPRPDETVCDAPNHVVAVPFEG